MRSDPEDRTARINGASIHIIHRGGLTNRYRLVRLGTLQWYSLLRVTGRINNEMGKLREKGDIRMQKFWQE